MIYTQGLATGNHDRRCGLGGGKKKLRARVNMVGILIGKRFGKVIPCIKKNRTSIDVDKSTAMQV